jgi:hypothetical protein
VLVSYMVKRECEQKATLLKAVANAMAAFYTARAKHDRRVSRNRNVAKYAEAMDAAERAERAAIAALNEHRKEHRC